MKASLSMHSYSKLFAEILDSSVWQQELHIKVVWVTMLAMKSPGDQIVRASIPGLAKRAGVTLEQCIEALELFKAPDPYSRIKDFEGRRIEECREGWLILNGHEYQMRMSEEDIRAAWREQKRREREKAQTESAAQPDLPPVPVEPPNGFPRTEADAVAGCMSVGAPDEFVRKTWNKAMARGGMDAKGVPIASWPHYVASELAYEREKPARTTAARSAGLDGKPHTVFELREVARAKEELATQIKERYSSPAAMGDNWSDDAKKQEWVALRREVKAIKQRMARMA